MSVFLLICVVSLGFFLLFLIHCFGLRRASKKAPVVRKLTTPQNAEFVAGRRTLIHLEQQMAEFLASHRHGIAAMVLAMAIVGTATQMKAQSNDSPAAGGSVNQQVPPAVQQQLNAMQKSNEALQRRIEQ